MNNDSTEFLVKTNKDVDEWMDSFYTDGRKADFRLHCQWAWQENERRHRTAEAEMLTALRHCEARLTAMVGMSDLCADELQKSIDVARAAIAKVKGIPQ